MGRRCAANLKAKPVDHDALLRKSATVAAGDGISFSDLPGWHSNSLPGNKPTLLA
jgi:hypothetical protein